MDKKEKAAADCSETASGFDFVPSGIDKGRNVTSFGLFPNPATGGRFNVSLEAARAISEVTITVSNAVGQIIRQQHYQQPGSSVFREISLGHVPAGIYFAEVVADGERMVRRVVVE